LRLKTDSSRDVTYPLRNITLTAPTVQTVPTAPAEIVEVETDAPTEVVEVVTTVLTIPSAQTTEIDELATEVLHEVLD
jgi:hypothetical protein